MSKVIVIGRNYTSRLGMIRALGENGHSVTVIKTNSSKRDIDFYSKYVDKYLTAKEPNRQLLIDTILSLANKEEKTIIIPVDDYAASAIDEHIQDLREDFLFPNINMEPGKITDLMDKEKQKVYAQKANLNVAESWVITPQNGNYIIPTSLKYPCFPKPQISFMGNKRCMKRCNNEVELRCALDGVLAKKPNCPFIIEQYIEIEKEYATLGFSDGKNVVIPAMIQLLRDGSGAHKGVTLQGRIMPCENFIDVISQFSDFIRSINFIGLFDIDSYESNGVLYFNELNLRFGASGYAITASGVNLPQMFVDYIEGNEKRYDTTILKESLFVNEKVAWEDYREGYLKHNEFIDYIKSADVLFIKSNIDIEPYKKFRPSWLTVLKNLVKRIIFKKK